MTTIYCSGYKESGVGNDLIINIQGWDDYLTEWLPEQKQPEDWTEEMMIKSQVFLHTVEQFYLSVFGINIFYFLKDGESLAVIMLQRLGNKLSSSFTIIDPSEHNSLKVVKKKLAAFELQPNFTLRFL